ncbi:TIR domain-containing protein [Lentzea sp. PSKA42]|uniref:TIR domain-containing protein n=1 Tax=Lentzea indica TaxID=2604800 RepID=A0ABX1FG18_9PSEU|nr:TIR domain-containing protein [Lentzea indica]NKE57870.1 TIR domain-containing protein [Lentzea indica]
MGEPEYDAFISYSRALDGALAPMLQRGVQRFAKPWYRLRALRVFLDDASLSANPGLWTSIEAALGRSRWLILMASPESAASKWVARELEWWLEHRSAQQILVVLTSGEYSQSVPAVVRKALGEEPRWVDLRWLRDAEHVDDSNPRLRECVADIASAVRGVPKDDLVGEHVRQHRRTVRLARGAVTALAVLTVSVLVAAFIAVGQRNDAVAQARTATARGLASAAVANLGTDLALSQLLAAQAYRTEPNGQTRAALFKAVTASPQLDRYLEVGGEVSALAASADGKIAVAGTKDGRVVRLDLAGGRTEQKVGERPVSSVATSADGGVVAAYAEDRRLRWDAKTGAVQDIGKDSAQAGHVAVSPSGRFTAVYAGSEAAARILVHDGRSGRVTEREDTTLGLLGLRLPDDETLVEIGYTDWVRRSPATLDVTSSAKGYMLPANGFWVGLSANGEHFGYSTEGGTRLWRTTEPAFDYDSHEAVLPAGPPDPVAVAITGDGTRTAVAAAGTIFVHDVKGPAAGERARLEGNAETPFVEFLGDNDHLVSASRDRLVLWDLTRDTRIGSELPTRVPVVCSACAAPWLASSNGRVAVSVLDELAVGSQVATVSPDGAVGPLAWNASGDKLFRVTPEGRVEIWDPSGLRQVGEWRSKATADVLIGMGTTADDRLVVVDENGDVQVLKDDSVRDIPLGREIRGEHTPTQSHVAAVSPDAALVAVVCTDSVAVVDTASGEVRDVPVRADSVTFAGDSLLVQRDESIEVWDARGTSLRRTVPRDPSYLAGVAASPDSALVAQLRVDRVLVLTDLATGELVGEVRLADQRSRFGRIGMAFTGNKNLVTAVSARKLYSWNFAPDNWVRAACASAGRDLTADEWRRYVGTEPPADLTCG